MNEPTVPSFVLDTNVLLDWLVFHDPSCDRLATAIDTGTVRWLAGAALRAEFDAVLARGVGAARLPDRRVIDRVWSRHAVMIEPPAPAARAPGIRQRCRCSDVDDQKFIDLALHGGADWLLSRDRAVLKVAREARQFGLAIVAPNAWTLVRP